MSDHPNQKQQPRVKCPKGTKVPRSVKIRAALWKSASQTDKNSYIRSSGIAIYESLHRSKIVLRDTRKTAPTSTPDADVE